ncbi:MAG TPA: serine/threonine-protein kinase [Planctomycetaceae bacterium]|nr:serine/threonine-protein kinase [Planctomycetaceae bacterium]
MPPERIGPYVIDEKIGAGGMGTVYRGRHTETGQVAAVKVLPPSLAREDGFVARFSREIDAMRQLTSPHVVRLFDDGEADGTWYYAMEYVDGETLTSRLRREKRLPWREAVEISIQICAALKAAHDAGIIHRDLKPSNLLLGRDGQVKLTDFGVAQVFAAGKLTKTGGIVGTAEFMSPEQARGSRATKKSDLYALGAVLYLMVTGQPPFRGKTALDVIQQHQFRAFDKPSRYVDDLPLWIENIICELLEKDPQKRPPDAYVLSRRFQEGLHRAESGLYVDATDADDGTCDPGAPTMAAEYGSSGPGAATLMRDLVRAEVERSSTRSLPARWLDNTWVLLGLLALLVAGGIAWFSNRTPSGDGTDPPPVVSEGERFLQLAQQYRRMGDVARARRTLTALAALLAYQPEASDLRKRAARMLDDLRDGERRAPGPASLLEATERQVVELLTAGRREEAVSLAAHAAALYEEDPDSAAALERIRERLQADQE